MKKIGLAILMTLIASVAFAQLPGKIPNKFGQTYSDNAYVRLGNSEDAQIGYNTSQTPDALVCEVSADSNNFIIMEKADSAYDFAHALATDPTLFIQSHNQTATEWISIKHNGTDGVIDVGTGKVSFPDGITAAITGNITGNVTGNIDGIVGGNTPAAGSFTTVTASSTIRSTAATNIGWSVVAGANTACNTTCTNACVFGQDTGGANKTILDCADATADLCVCAGAN